MMKQAGAVAAIAREGDDGAGSVVSKPLLKWAGGKRAQLADILPHVRDAISRGTGRLFEPFAGGAAVTLAVGPQGGLLSDALGDLMVLYRIVRDDPQSVHAQMTSLATRGTSKAAYLAVRALRASDPTQAAARLIYLNRVGFNGLYRTNRKGEFNVPHGKRADGRDLEPAWPTMADFASAARALSGVATRVDDWRGAIASTSKGDVIYADPPYEGCFTGYGPKWAVEDFDALAETLHNLAREGRYVIVSQPDAETTRKRYAWCPRIVEIARPKGYAIGGKGARRGATGELLCLGYAPVTRPNQNEVK
jgi:DNA adenine methylase